MKRSELLRIVDANLNRSREGLRVCEEITRFVLKDAPLTRRLKTARHAISSELRRLPVSLKELTASRNAAEDVGRKPSALENRRETLTDLFLANSGRAKEAVRVLEEVSKLLDPKAGARFKKVRFDVYTIEKKSLPKLETLRRH